MCLVEKVALKCLLTFHLLAVALLGLIQHTEMTSWEDRIRHLLLNSEGQKHRPAFRRGKTEDGGKSLLAQNFAVTWESFGLLFVFLSCWLDMLGPNQSGTAGSFGFAQCHIKLCPVILLLCLFLYIYKKKSSPVGSPSHWLNNCY